MFDDLAAYYHENVISSFVEYRDICNDGVAGRSRDLRAALNAASALFHLREHLPGGAPTRADTEHLCPDYALLGDVVNTSKHKVLNSKTPHGAPLVNDAENLGEQLVFIEYEDDAGTYRFVQKTVVVKLSDGSERNLLEILTNVLNFWEQHMLSIGVLSTVRVFVSDSGIRPRLRTECEANRLNFQIVQGQRFHQTMRLLRFNNKTGKAEPIDLTGPEIRFRIYRPKYDVELSLTHDASGKAYKTEITLTEEEIVILSRMSNDEERQAYVNALPAAQAALQKLAVEAGLAKDSHG
jgi:hypothetical protein